MTFFIWLVLLEVFGLVAAGLVPRSLPVQMTEPTLSSDQTPEQKNRSQTTRKRRCLGTMVSLLWPQVVGPVDGGVIVEKTFDELPKTLLEYRLDRMRKKAKEEESHRLAVRAYMQKRLEKVDQMEFPNFHTTHLGFVDLVHRLPYFNGVLLDNNVY